jgi:hypothetical protein
MPEKCHVILCTNPAVAKGLCRKHYMQVQRHGEVVDTRPGDWGSREKHSAYSAWCNLKRHHRQELCQEWLDDFWVFVAEVGEKPESSTACRSDNLVPWCKDNFYWKEKRSSSDDQKEYARAWHKKSRAANPEYYLDQDLRRNYGVTLEWYRKILSAQNDSCAICKQPETTKIRGKVIAMAVDHCHTSGEARGLLCTQCNRALGLFKDNKSVLEAAIGYLEKHKQHGQTFQGADHAPIF